jgi:tetrahydromethanopterin S-methyltransferase subunit G
MLLSTLKNGIAMKTKNYYIGLSPEEEDRLFKKQMRKSGIVMGIAIGLTVLFILLLPEVIKILAS